MKWTQLLNTFYGITCYRCSFRKLIIHKNIISLIVLEDSIISKNHFQNFYGLTRVLFEQTLKNGASSPRLYDMKYAESSCL